MFEHLRADLRRFADERDSSSGLRRAMLVLETQGAWAMAVYRFGRFVHRHRYRDPPARIAPLSLWAMLPLRVFYRISSKMVEIATGIQIPASVEIGPGLYIGHFGQIIFHRDAVLGAGCSVGQGVTIGVAGRGRPGAPRLGDRVYVGAGAKILGPITIGDDAVVGANAVVLRDVPPGWTAVGVPAANLPPREQRLATAGADTPILPAIATT